MTADLILSSLPKEQAGAASPSPRRRTNSARPPASPYSPRLQRPAGYPGEAHESLGGAVEAASRRPANVAEPLLDAARQFFVDGLTRAAGVRATVLPAAAVASWFMLRDQRIQKRAPAANV
ncbi:hypothetical protein ACIQCD_04035 [Streptomyces sp. NPDC093250]|uniref:hypothetical protein n=1 Tax=Streptomyces sp. NPDC093250 TaxID=3366036 RepID=UPI00382E2BBF